MKMRMHSYIRRPLPLVTVALTVAILGVYGLEFWSGNGLALCHACGFVPARPTLLTALSSMLLHDPIDISHVVGNVAVLGLVGTYVERALGSVRFLAVCVAGHLAGAGLHWVVDPASAAPLAGCSGGLFALLAVAADLYGPVALAIVAFLVITNISHAFGALGADGVSFGCHLGGYCVGVIVVALARLGGVDLFPGMPRAAAVGVV